MAHCFSNIIFHELSHRIWHNVMILLAHFLTWDSSGYKFHIAFIQELFSYPYFAALCRHVASHRFWRCQKADGFSRYISTHFRFHDVFAVFSILSLTLWLSDDYRWSFISRRLLIYYYIWPDYSLQCRDFFLYADYSHEFVFSSSLILISLRFPSPHALRLLVISRRASFKKQRVRHFLYVISRRFNVSKMLFSSYIISVARQKWYHIHTGFIYWGLIFTTLFEGVRFWENI